MKYINLPQWKEVLDQSSLTLADRIRHATTLRWYLSWCRRVRTRICKDSAIDFIKWAERSKNPSAQAVESWKEAIRWLFRTAKQMQAFEEGSPLQPSPVNGPTAPRPKGGTHRFWFDEFRRIVRLRHYSYQTEKTYLEWVRRFALNTQDLSAATITK